MLLYLILFFHKNSAFHIKKPKPIENPKETPMQKIYSSALDIPNSYDFGYHDSEKHWQKFMTDAQAVNTVIIDVRNARERAEIDVFEVLGPNSDYYQVNYLDFEGDGSKLKLAVKNDPKNKYVIICGIEWCACRWQYGRWWGYRNISFIHRFNYKFDKYMSA